MPTGASRSSRGGQTQAWRHSALPVCPPSRGVVADTPWEGGPSLVGLCQDPALETQSLPPKNSRLPLRFLGRVGGARGVQGWLQGLGSQGHRWQVVKCEPQGLETWFPFVIFFSLGTDWFYHGLFSSLSVGDSEVKEFVV